MFAVARETGALVMVHAENYDAIRFLTERLERAGKTAPRFHATSRPIAVEREATHRAISLAELVDVPIMIVHVSNGEAMEQIRWAQQRGLKVFGETCPQYLVLTEKDLDGLNMEGAKYVCSPPPRDAASQKACWLGLETGVFQVFSSDHCPFRYDDARGQARSQGPHQLPLGAERHSGRRDTAADPVLRGRREGAHHAEPVRGAHRHQPRQDVRAVSAQGHDRRRRRCGHRHLGPRAPVTISQALLHHGSDYTPYEGLEVTGWPVTTLVRGMTVVRDGTLVASSRTGRHVPRDRSPYASPVPRPE